MNYTFDNERPIYIQLVEKLRIEIVSGKLKPGERIASVRELAFTTKVNPNTMQKALVELEGEGLIYTERTNGKFITTDQNLIEKAKTVSIESVFILTTQTADWFEKQGFVADSIDTLPERRRKIWNPKRGSKLFRLNLKK